MSGDLSPDDALSPEAFSSLYAGGLAIEDETDRLDACLAILLLGRVGLRPEELAHLHEGWIDWRTGELRIPAHDPCACAQCWERAQQLAADGDDRDPAAIVGTDLWSPPGEDAARSLAFGWSRRLTAALGTVLAEREYIDTDRETLESLVSAAAANATGVDESVVDLDVLRASAVEFLASAGFGPRRLADLTAIDEEQAGDFARVSSGEVRDYLYRALGEEDLPRMDGVTSRYRVVAESTRFDREPFDPSRFGADWRADRSMKSELTSRNPRPVEVPEGTPFEPAVDLRTREPAGSTGFDVVPESLAEWVDELESLQGVPVTGPTSERAGGGESTTADASAGAESSTAEPSTAEASAADPETDLEPADPTAEAPIPGDGAAITAGIIEDPQDQVTEPVEFSFDTRFAAAELDDHRPSGGTVVLGQQEFVVLSRDHTGISGYLRIEFEDVVELVPGYVPERLAEHFGDTVGIAYLNDEAERKVVVCEVGSQIQLAFVQAVFRSILTDISTLVTDLPQYERQLENDELRLSAERQALRFWGESPGFAKLRYDAIVDVEPGPMTDADDAESGLVVRQLTANDTVSTTRVRPTSDRLYRLLGRFLTLHVDRNRERAETVSVSSDELAVLEALSETGECRDPATELDVDRTDLSDLISSLEVQDLVRQTTGGTELTAAGLLVVEDEEDEEDEENEEDSVPTR